MQEILKIALVGTEKQAVVLSEGSEGVAPLFSQLDTSDRERALLSAAGIMTLWRRAGYVPETNVQPLPTPCEAEDLPRCPPEVMQQIVLRMRDNNRSMLMECLELVGAKQRRVAEEYLPQLLQLGQSNTQLREPVAGVIGKRGRWLATQNPDWSYAYQLSFPTSREKENGEAPFAKTPEESETLWQVGFKEARLELLAELRLTQPAFARQLVELTWKQYTPDDRATFVETFRIGLSMEDEPFLEQALDDSRKVVRMRAIELLSQLPESRLVKRMITRVVTGLSPMHSRNPLPSVPPGKL